jgi:nucleotide-binding universal stress UspA family protein
MRTTPPVVVAVVAKQPNALRLAVDEARSSRAPLRVVHATGLPAQSAEFYIGFDASMIDQVRVAGQAVLDDARHLIEELAPTLDVTYVLTEQSPLDALRSEAAGARVVVLGADDVAWVERLLRSKIAGYLVTHAPCPVIVVPELAFPSGPDGEVVVSLDGDSSAAGPLRLAFDEADARDCVLHVLHSTPPGTLASDAEAMRANVSEVLAGWRERYPDVMVLEGFPIDLTTPALVRATESAALVVVGRPHRHSLSLSLSRPVAVKVLAEAQCPVAVVPPDYQGV